MSTCPRLPERVTLPSSAMIDAAHLRAALGVSKQLLHLWRAKGFPAFFRDGAASWTVTDDVARWLASHDVEVIRK